MPAHPSQRTGQAQTLLYYCSTEYGDLKVLFFSFFFFFGLVVARTRPRMGSLLRTKYTGLTGTASFPPVVCAGKPIISRLISSSLVGGHGPPLEWKDAENNRGLSAWGQGKS